MNNCLIVNTSEGSLQLNAETLIIALDETGHEEFADDSHPVFGIGGCITLVTNYNENLAIPFENMLSNYFKGVDRPFHMTSEASKGFGHDQKIAISNFFLESKFARIASVMTKETKIELENALQQYFNIQILCLSIVKRIQEIAKYLSFNRAFLIYEDSQRIGGRIMSALQGKTIENKNKETISVELGLMKQLSPFPALEVADAIARSAGRQARHKLSGKRGFLKDFQDIFQSVDIEHQSFILIEHIKEN